MSDNFLEYRFEYYGKVTGDLVNQLIDWAVSRSNNFPVEKDFPGRLCTNFCTVCPQKFSLLCPVLRRKEILEEGRDNGLKFTIDDSFEGARSEILFIPLRSEQYKADIAFDVELPSHIFVFRVRGGCPVGKEMHWKCV